MTENIIIIPVYNDWKSLNKLLLEINQTLNDSDLCKILIINDCSTQKIHIENKNLEKIKEIKILSLKRNLGSQKSISIGLNYLKGLDGNFYITVMDGDGEDSPSEIKQMLTEAKVNNNYIVTSHRKDRNEKFIKFSLSGLAALLVFQTFIHLGVNTSLLPTTGMTLPFLSYGGSSMIGSAILAGIVLNFTGRRF